MLEHHFFNKLLGEALSDQLIIMMLHRPVELAAFTRHWFEASWR